MPAFMHGIFDDAWVNANGADRQAIVAEMAGKLHVDVVRIDLRWALAEPTAAGEYDEDYLGRLRDAAAAAHAAGMRVMIDVFAVPQWASDSSWWDKPLEGVAAGYQSYYPVAGPSLDAWEATAEYLVRYFQGKVTWWECWNEPNLWSYIYPQATPDDEQFAAHRYMELLERFSRAVHKADPEAKVLGGVTAPFGMNDELRTAPQRFLGQLKELGAEKHWDGVSHHPYTPAGVSPMPAPTAKPRFPEYSVTLGNISTLLKMFPDEPFYLTEYGYPTEPSAAWGTAFVSEPTQAAYLTTAFKHAATFDQVKLLNWFLWRDIDVGADRIENAFFGLRRPDNTKKASWYAFRQLR